MSESYIVSARKYRPQRFDEVVGQESTTGTLKNAIKNKQLAHSFLFCGSRGVGKTTIARILAKTINCKELQSDGEACDKCDSCTSFNNNASFNIHELDAASKNSVDDMRGLIEQVQYAPQNAAYKVFIIDEVHMLSTSAFNAFLKTLEEPPSYAKFILATTEKHKVLPTILSRCQIYDFGRIKVSDIQHHLKKICQAEKIDAEENALHLIAQKADGGLRDALSMFDRLVSIHGNKLLHQDVLKNLNILDYDFYFQFVDRILQEASDHTLLLLQDVLMRGFELDTFLSGLAEHIRNLWVAKRENTMILLEAPEEVRQQFLKQAALLDEPLMLNLLQVITDCEVTLKTARNRRLVVELALLKLCYVKRVITASWTDADQKKKWTNTPIEPRQPVATAQKVIAADEPRPRVGAEKAIDLQDLLNITNLKKVQETEDQKSTIIDLPLYSQEMWTEISSRFEGELNHQRTKLHSLQPQITDTEYIIYATNSLEQTQIQAYVPELLRIAKKLSGQAPEIKIDIDSSKAYAEDLNTKQEFEELEKQYPILATIRDEFRIVF